METVEVVIRLPQNLYLDVKNGYASNIQREKVIERIKSGTVLPKGHGVLKDVTNLMRGLFEEMLTDSKGKIIYTPSDVYRMIDEECPTSIKADKEV